jgi:hypothetical protein
MHALLVALFVAERAHQWQGLLARDWSVRWQGRDLRRKTVVLTVLVIAWGEGLGFYVQGERAFWGMVFWVYAAHVVLTAWQTSRPLVAAAVSVAAGAAMLCFGGLDPNWPATWLGFSLLSWTPGLSGAAAVAAVVALHSVPCFVRNLRRTSPRAAAIGAGCAVVEWFVVAKSIWFPPGSLFPDLPDWWNLGDGGGFVMLPLWMTPFLAHVVIDAIRHAQPPRSAAA